MVADDCVHSGIDKFTRKEALTSVRKFFIFLAPVDIHDCHISLRLCPPDERSRGVEIDRRVSVIDTNKGNFWGRLVL